MNKKKEVLEKMLFLRRSPSIKPVCVAITLAYIANESIEEERRQEVILKRAVEQEN